MTMIRLTPDDWYEITGRGWVAIFDKENQPPDGIHPRDLIGKVVFIGDKPYEVRGLEHWCIVCPRDEGGTCGHPYGLLVEYLEHYWDGFIDQRPGLPGFMR